MLLYFFRNFGFLLLLNVLIKPIWVFAIDIPVQNAVGHDVYGLFFTAFNFSMIFSILSDLGLNHFNNINLSDQSVQRVYSVASLLPAKLMLSIVYVLIATVAGILVFGEGSILYFIFLTSVFHASSGFILFLRTYLSSSQKFGKDSLYSVLDRFISTMILFVWLYLIPMESFQMEYFVYVQIFSAGVPVLLLLIHLRKDIGVRFRFVPESWLWLKAAAPYSLLILLMGLYTRIDSTLIQLLLGSNEAGIYAASYRLVDFLSQFGYLSSIILLPLFAHLKKEEEVLKKLFSSILIIMFFTGVFIAVSMFYLSETFCEILYTSDAKEISKVFRIHLISYPFIVANFIVGSYITAHKYLRFLILISIAGIVVILTAIGLLISGYGVVGVAVAMVVTHVWIFVAQLWWIGRKHGLPSVFSWQWWYAVWIGAALMLVLAAGYSMAWLAGAYAVLALGILVMYKAQTLKNIAIQALARKI
ncbi:oligosaccharide flippase family protein [Schleiferia thermophila]|uniref:O-antigen/teichoic acid export membrane protein n=1 Tax=Schleiferia thermophila TaxID=884107 RepID=A0A369A438_9FLAO|nr:oligosaccharide flippase family protein [Schleiferia thermophila]RCX03933.1 O-antigen/teichoic acid export membrane protein [Schleiferia thermophila]GCD80166.1 transporter [Schleiferia thermophila]